MTQNETKGDKMKKGTKQNLLLITTILLCGCQQKVEKPPLSASAKKLSQDINIKQNCKEEYQRGVNTALQSIMLHDLELRLKGDRMTWGERAKIVRARLKVKK